MQTTDYTVRFLKFHEAQKTIYRDPAKRKLVVAGRRFGKTTMLEQAAGNWGAQGRRVGWFAPSYKVLLPSYKAIRDLVRPITINANKTDMIIELIGGGHIEFWTLDNEDAGRSRKYHNAIIDEASLVKKGLRDTWEQAIEPTLLDYNGDCIMCGTPKGTDDENYFFKAHDNKELGWKEFHAPTLANPKMEPEAYELITRGKPPLVIQQEYGAQFINWNGQNFFKAVWLLEDNQPVPFPSTCDNIYAIVDCAQKGGIANDGSAIIFFALDTLPVPHLVILDWDIIQIDGYYLQNYVPQWVERCRELALICRARLGTSGLFIEDKSTGTTLLQQGANLGWPVTPIDSGLTALGKEERAINISGYVAGGQVKISEYAFNKLTEFKGATANHMLKQVLQFVIGEKDQADDLFDCFNYGVALGLGNGEGF